MKCNSNTLLKAKHLLLDTEDFKISTFKKQGICFDKRSVNRIDLFPSRSMAFPECLGNALSLVLPAYPLVQTLISSFQDYDTAPTSPPAPQSVSLPAAPESSESHTEIKTTLCIWLSKGEGSGGD